MKTKSLFHEYLKFALLSVGGMLATSCYILGRHLFCSPRPGRPGFGGAEPGHPGLQFHPRRRVDAGHGRRHQICHLEEPGEPCKCRPDIHHRPAAGRPGRWPIPGSRAVRRLGPHPPAGGGCGHFFHVADLSAGDAPVLPCLFALRCAGLLRPQRRRPPPCHGVHHWQQFCQRGAGLSLHLSAGYGDLWRGVRHRALPPHRHLVFAPPLAASQPWVPPGLPGAGAPSRRFQPVFGHPLPAGPALLRRGDDRLQPHHPGPDGQHRRGGLSASWPTCLWSSALYTPASPRAYSLWPAGSTARGSGSRRNGCWPMAWLPWPCSPWRCMG